MRDEVFADNYNEANREFLVEAKETRCGECRYSEDTDENVRCVIDGLIVPEDGFCEFATPALNREDADELIRDVVGRRPKGWWRPAKPESRSWRFRCSECGGDAYWPQNCHSKEKRRECGYPTCPWCHAEMRGVKEWK